MTLEIFFILLDMYIENTKLNSVYYSIFLSWQVC